MMKKITLLFLLFSFISTAYSNENLKVDDNTEACKGAIVGTKSKNTSSPALVTSGGKMYLEECFNTFLMHFVSSLDDKPLVLFIHGRGKHPSKTFEKDNRLLHRIEKQYQVKALIFSWASWCGKFCLPKESALKASTSLYRVIKQLDKLKRDLKTKSNFSLLSHSMGAYVLKGLEVKSVDDVSNELFSSILISAAATPTQGHESWIEPLNISKSIYIISNKNDGALKCLEGARFFCTFAFNEPKLLGRWGAEQKNTNIEGASINYVDFTDHLGKRHRYYINMKKKSRNVFDFYSALFRGKDPSRFIN